MGPTFHRPVNGDARDLSFLKDESVHLVVTSPPYWNLKKLLIAGFSKYEISPALL